MGMDVMVIWAIENHILCLNLFCMFSNPHRVKRIHTPPLICLYSHAQVVGVHYVSFTWVLCV